MWKQAILSILLLCFMAVQVSAEPAPRVEIFDLQKEKVVKRIAVRPAVQKEVKSYLKGITALYTKVKPIPEQGYIVRVPLGPSVKLKNKWVDTEVDEVLVIIPAQGTPTLLVFNEKNQPYFFLFQGEVEQLWRLLQFQPKQAAS